MRSGLLVFFVFFIGSVVSSHASVAAQDSRHDWAQERSELSGNKRFSRTSSFYDESSDHFYAPEEYIINLILNLEQKPELFETTKKLMINLNNAMFKVNGGRDVAFFFFWNLFNTAQLKKSLSGSYFVEAQPFIYCNDQLAARRAERERSNKTKKMSLSTFASHVASAIDFRLLFKPVVSTAPLTSENMSYEIFEYDNSQSREHDRRSTVSKYNVSALIDDAGHTDEDKQRVRDQLKKEGFVFADGLVYKAIPQALFKKYQQLGGEMRDAHAALKKEKKRNKVLGVSASLTFAAATIVLGVVALKQSLRKKQLQKKLAELGEQFNALAKAENPSEEDRLKLELEKKALEDELLKLTKKSKATTLASLGLGGATAAALVYTGSRFVKRF